MKDSFILYTKYEKQLQALTMEQRGILFTAILCHENQKPIPEMDATTAMAYSFIEYDLEENARKYEEICEKRSVWGSMGGRPKKANGSEKPNGYSEKHKASEKPKGFEKSISFSEKHKVSEKADNDNEYDNDNDLKEKASKKKVEPKHKHGEYSQVALTDNEYQKLGDVYGSQTRDAAIAFLDAYIAEKGYKSKSHYLAIRRWVIDALKEKRGSPKAGKFGNFPQRSDDKSKELIAKVIAMQ